MITLKEFVKDTLDQVIEAMNEIDVDPNNRATTKPYGIAEHMKNAKSEYIWDRDGWIIPVSIDVAVTIDESDKVAGKGGVKVMGIGASIDGEATTNNSQTNRVAFKVPLQLKHE